MNLPKLPKLTRVDKALAAAAGLLAQIIELGVLHGTALHYAQIASGAVATALVYLAHGPSKPAPAPVAPVAYVPPAAPAAPPAPPAPTA